MKDELGDRMKGKYENVTRIYLPQRTYVIIRLDGKAFHTYTKGCAKPFDADLIEAMDYTTVEVCKRIQGVKFVYTQSDEISILLTDFDDITTSMWFDGNIQKICSVSASMATAHFNDSDFALLRGPELAYFDARVFTIPDPTEVYNYFVWRQKDCIRNSIQAVGQANFSPKQLEGMSCEQIVYKLFEKDVCWDNMSAELRVGRIAETYTTDKDIEYTDKRTGETKTVVGVKRKEWRTYAPPVFTEHPDWLKKRIPAYV